MSTQKERMYARIEEHGKRLIGIFGLPNDTDPITLCKKLFSLENHAHHTATMSCNGMISEEDEEKDDILVSRRFLKITGKSLEYPYKLNKDARGYALKIDDEYMRENSIILYSDWGGYGIIAPDLTTDAWGKK
jgi:hypothetical protein